MRPLAQAQILRPWADTWLVIDYMTAVMADLVNDRASSTGAVASVPFEH